MDVLRDPVDVLCNHVGSRDEPVDARERMSGVVRDLQGAIGGYGTGVGEDTGAVVDLKGVASDQEGCRRSTSTWRRTSRS